MRAIGLTLRIRLDDRSGLLDEKIKHPVIWTFWHNRMFIIPTMQSRYYPHRRGSALTSASKDGAIIAGVMKCFGLGSVRGSSSRRGSTAIRELASVIERGEDIAVTPDGPRGPCYKLGLGVIFLAQKTGAPVVPIHVEYSRSLRLKSWDRFMIPLPFSRVHVRFDELFRVSDCATDSALEARRAQLEQIMQPEHP